MRTGSNCIEQSFPVNKGEKVDPKKIQDCNLGISGESFGMGDWSKRKHQAISSKSFFKLPHPKLQALQIYALGFTAKGALQAALN